MNPTSQLLLPEVSELIAEREFRALRESLSGVPAADVADLLADLPLEEAAVCFRLLPRDEAGDVFAELDADLQSNLIEQLGDIRSRQAIEALDPDDRARVLDELPTEVAKRLISSLSPATRRETQAILGYPADSVGRLMTPDYVRLRPDWTVARALEQIRRFGHDAETVHWIFVIDSHYRLIDDLHIRQLLLADPETEISEIMDDAFIALDADDDREDAVRMMSRYDRTALPVIDSRGVLLGIVTHDDVADVAEEEVTEDIQKQAGMEALAKPYMQTGLAEMIKKRGGWLCVLLLLQVATIGVLDMFQSQLEKAAILVSFIPLIISSGEATTSTRLVAKAEFGIPSKLAVLGSWTSTNPSRSLMPRKPRLPSVPVPDRMIEMALSPTASAREWKNRSIGRLSRGRGMGGISENRRPISPGLAPPAPPAGWLSTSVP